MRGKIIEVNGHEYSLGELTTDFLNITPEEYRQLSEHFAIAEEKVETYRSDHNLDALWAVNEELIEFDSLLIKHKAFQAVRDPAFSFFEDVREFTGQMRLTESDLSHSASEIETAWNRYEKMIAAYEMILHDVRAFNTTIHNFINHFLSDLKRLNSENYAAALWDFLNNERRNKWIVNPIDNNGDIYFADDFISVRHVPREMDGLYYIYDEFTVDNMQSLLWADFMKALMAGFIIRRCENCGRYFLLKKAYRTKYCISHRQRIRSIPAIKWATATAA
jgi:RNAse (barnase) inhibitor barstar